MDDKEGSTLVWVFGGIIFVVIIALIVIFGFILSDAFSRATFDILQSDNEVEVVKGSVDFSGDFLSLDVTRVKGDREIQGLRFVLDDGEKDFNYEVDTSLDVAEIKTFSIPTQGFISDVKQISVIAIYADIQPQQPATPQQNAPTTPTPPPEIEEEFTEGNETMDNITISNVSCTLDSDCNDDLFCNGVETCNEGICVSGINPCTVDAYSCTTTCDEVSDSCNVLNNGSCISGNSCSVGSCIGSGGDSNGCYFTNITQCINADSCCPAGCDSGNDNDCPLSDDSNLVLYLSLDGNFVDSSGNGHDGSCTECPTSTAGRVNGAYDFDRSVPQAVIIDDSSKSFEFLDDFTVAAWIYPRSGPGSEGRTVVSKYTSSPYYGWNLGSWWGDGDEFRFGVWKGDGTDLYAGDTPSTNYLYRNGLNEWHHVVGVYEWDGATSTVTLYIDGTFNDTKSASWPVAYLASTTDLVIGRRSSTDQSGFDGKIDEVRIYNQALSSNEVSDLYDSY